MLTVDEFTDADLAQTRLLQEIQTRLWEAGQRYDLEAAEQIIKDAGNALCRPVDILVGIVAPLLYEVGEKWKNGIMTVAEEHRFTAFCEGVFNLIIRSYEMPAMSSPSDLSDEHVDVMLVNAAGNRHTLAIRILAVWLLRKGLCARTVHPCPRVDELMALIEAARPRMLLVSMALDEHRPRVVAIADGVASLPPAFRPRIIVGGNAVKQGQVETIPGTEFMADISMLELSPG